MNDTTHATAPAPSTAVAPPLGAARPSAAGTPTFLEALRRVRLVRDENGQAMVEMVIVAPFLVYLMVMVMYFFEIHDAQQDHYINIQRGYWNVLTGASAGRTFTASDSGNFGWSGMTANIQTSGGGAPGILNSLTPSLRTIATGYHPVALLLGDDYGRSFDFGNILPYIVALAGTNSTPLSIALQGGTQPGQNFSFFGPPYEKAGLPYNNYDSTNPAPFMLTNPFANSLLGMASFFSNRGRAGADDPGILAQQLSINGHFRLVTGDWAADTEQQIRDRAGNISYFGSPHGLAVKVISGLFWLSIPGDLFGLAPAPSITTTGFMGRFMRDWYNRGRDYAWMPNKIDSSLTATASNPLSNTKINGQVVDYWK